MQKLNYLKIEKFIDNCVRDEVQKGHEKMRFVLQDRRERDIIVGMWTRPRQKERAGAC